MVKNNAFRLIKNVAPKWKEAVAEATGSVYVFSPFITRMADQVFLLPKTFTKRTTAECHVYTRFEQELFVTQRSSTGPASSIDSLKRLSEANVKIYHVPNLHAKVLVIPNQFASVGSQNLTTWGGTLSREASLATKIESEVQNIFAAVQAWITEAEWVSPERIEKMVNVIRALAPAERFRKGEFAALDAKLAACDAELLAKEEVRQQKRKKRLENEQAAAALVAEKEARFKRETDELEEKQRKDGLQNLNSKLGILAVNGGVPRKVAEGLIKSSDYWLYQRHGPCPSPGSADKLRGDETNWRMIYSKFDQFLVAIAVTRCQQSLDSFVKKMLAGRKMSYGELFEELRLNVRGAVADGFGKERPGYKELGKSKKRFNNIEKHMVFGSHSIDTEAFIKELLSMVSLPLFRDKIWPPE